VFGVGCIDALKCFEFDCDIILFQSGHKHSKIIFNLQLLLWMGKKGLNRGAGLKVGSIFH
jgi:hypothetical protein